MVGGIEEEEDKEHNEQQIYNRLQKDKSMP